MECNDTYFWCLLKDTDFVAAVIGAVLSGLFAIAVFKYGISNEKRQQQEGSKSKLSELKIYFETLVKALPNPIDKQVDKIEKFISQLNKREFPNYEFSIENDLKIQYVKEISHKDIYDIYIAAKGKTEERTQNFKNLIDGLDLVKSTHGYLGHRFDEFHTRHVFYEDKFRECLKSIVTAYEHQEVISITNSFLVSGENSLVESIKEIFDSFNNSDVIPKNDPYNVFDNVIEPIRKLCGTYKMGISPEFSSESREALIVIRSNDDLRDLVAKQFLMQKEQLLKAKELIQDSIKKLNSI